MTILLSGKEIYWDKDKKRTGYKHRDIMESYLGRKLLPQEVVHHKDGNPGNNKIENLELIQDNWHHFLGRHSNVLFGGFEGRVKGGEGRRKIQDGLLWCSDCKQWLTPESFYKNKSRWNGHHSVCRECYKKQRKAKVTN